MNNWTWTLVNKQVSDAMFQDEDGNFLHDTIFLELSAFAFEYFFGVLSVTQEVADFESTLKTKWMEKKKQLTSSTLGFYPFACFLIYASINH